MGQGSDWFDDIFAGDPLRADPPQGADRPGSGSGGEPPSVTDGFEDLFVDFDEDDPQAGDAGATAADARDTSSARLDAAQTAAAGPRVEPTADEPPPAEPTADEPPPAEPSAEVPTDEAPAPPAPDEAAYAGEGWAGDEGTVPQEAPWVSDIDTSPVPHREMTGLWLTTESDRESPLRLDGQPIEPEELDLAPEIVDRLLDWSDQWRAQWDEAQGWLPRARIGDYEALGHWLARRVKDGAGAVEVTLQLAHLGRAGVERIAAADVRAPLVVQLSNAHGRRFPVVGDFVTDSGVGSFTAELNAKLEGWAEHFAAHMDPVLGWGDARAARDHATFAGELVGEMTDELGPDYRVELDLWEVLGVLEAQGPAR
ncbi:hypothetical protein BJY21_000884 [Kineosphaera limosa]|uniref:Uncharacterized protein n=1 Tax=Kineosphaera limosa NBRC 100340 TaxID=1184609 RepID=K6VHH1_9MICO|nr:hypothetical protein [Kineosphaera limosa]NYD99699.1 hypothetical protein [Kineosphaera limosa]GAB95653.1 hypothetical protein KILIM_024_00640 [Kineosphaera limosa NBRC 100340]